MEAEAVLGELGSEAFAAQHLKIMDKRDQMISFIWNAVQRDYFGKRTARDLILKPRQIGFSTLIQGEFYRLATTEPARTLTLTDSDDNTQKLRRMTDRFHDHMPDGSRQPRKYANASVTTYAQLGSEAMIATAGNKQVGRAGSYRFIHLSEAAFYPDLQSILASALQGGNPQWVVMESTPNGAQGKFYDLCMDALRGDGVWALHFYTWFDFPDYRLPLREGETLTYTVDEQRLVDKHGLTPEQIQWRRYKIAELGSLSLFQQEYAEDVMSCFRASGSNVFGDFAVYTPEDHAKPVPGHDYTAGLDWGQDLNFTSLSIIDATDNREVFLNRWRRMPWAEMRSEMVAACRYWNVSRLTAERNAASSNLEDLDGDIYRAQLPISLSGFTMTHKRKGELIGHFNRALHEEGLELLDIPWASAEMRSITTKQNDSGLWVYVQPLSDDGAHGDSLIARLLAWHGAMNRIPESYGS